jgi:hypothetical protein
MSEQTDLKYLEKLLKLCRKQGVQEINLGNVSFKLGDIQAEINQTQSSLQDDSSSDPYANFPQGELTPEQLMFYSAGGLPDDDPNRKDHQ